MLLQVLRSFRDGVTHQGKAAVAIYLDDFSHLDINMTAFKEAVRMGNLGATNKSKDFVPSLSTDPVIKRHVNGYSRKSTLIWEEHLPTCLKVEIKKGIYSGCIEVLFQYASIFSPVMQSQYTQSPSPRSTSSPLPSTNATTATGNSGITLFSDEEDDGGIMSANVNFQHAFEIAVVTLPVCPAVTATDEAMKTSSPAVTATDEATETSSSVYLAVTADTGTSLSSMHPDVIATDEPAGILVVEKSSKRKRQSNAKWGSHKRPTRQNTQIPEWSKELNSTNPLQKWNYTL